MSRALDKDVNKERTVHLPLKGVGDRLGGWEAIDLAECENLQSTFPQFSKYKWNMQGNSSSLLWLLVGGVPEPACSRLWPMSSSGGVDSLVGDFRGSGAGFDLGMAVT